MAEDTRSAAAPLVSGADIRTFLFADMRGYTRFTQEQGDDAASALAGRFADLVREAVPEFEGELLELRGDEALCVFRSARQALRASVELQRRLRTGSDDEPAFPIGVGMGLDAGEAVPTHGGYRGAALNLAARLCALAKPGEILATENVAHFAHRVDGLRLLEGRSASLKGMARPVRYVVVEPERPLPPAPAAPSPMRRASRRHVILGVGGTAAVLAGVLFGLSSHGGTASARTFTRPAVYQVDPASGRVDLGLALGDEPTGLAATPTAVWVADSGDGTVTRIMPSGRTQSIPVGNGPTGVVAFGHAIWATLSLDDTVVRIDPTDDRVFDPIPAGDDPTAIAAGDGKLWVTNESRNTVTPIDPDTGRAEAPITVGGGPNSIVAGPSDVWVGNSLTSNVTDLDPTDGHTRQVFLLDGDPTSLTAAPGGGVLAATATGALWHIDRGGKQRITALGVQPQASTTFDGKLWVAASAAPAPHRGGTLVLATQRAPQHPGTPGWASIDPASLNAYWYPGWTTLAMTNDGLVTFKKVGGAGGGTVVPDLARAIPTPTHGGRMWTFTVRPNIPYSDGELVRPSDFRRAFERLFKLGSGFYYTDIVGAAACSAQRCDLRRGIVTDDQHHTVSFVLTKPDPDFLDQLALPFADAVPPSVPDTDQVTKPIPATGPYMITSFTPTSGALMLARNPRFHVWSRDAQPAGYPDHIEWKPFRTGLAELNAVEHGQADWMYDLAPEAALRRAELSHPNQFHPSIFPYTGTLTLAVGAPPFNDSRARTALNLAMNREAYIAAAHAEGQQVATCQLSPPNMFGYAPICPNGPPPPDLATARRDVELSGTKGMTVTVSTPKTADERLVFRTLASIGYRPAWISSLDSPEVYVQPVEVDYPSTASFLEFACPGFCQRYPKLQSLINRAKAAELTDQPGRAGPIWNEAEREYLRVGPSLIPLTNASSPGFVSARVGNYQFAPTTGDSPLIDQMWVK